MTLRTRKDIGNCKGKHWFIPFVELALDEVLDLSEEVMIMTICNEILMLEM